MGRGGASPPLLLQRSIPSVEAAGLLHLARIHGVSGYVHHVLSDRSLTHHWPPDIRDDLARDFRRNFSRYLLMRRLLTDLSRLARSHEIPLYQFKGIGLAELTFPHPAARHAGDIDILVPSGKAGELRDKAAAAGIDLTMCELEENHHDLTMDGAFPVNLEEIWRASARWELDGCEVRIPAAEHALLIQAITCCRRGFWNLRSLLDAREIIRCHGARMDTEYLARCAEAWGLSWALGTVLRLVKERLGTGAAFSPLIAWEPSGARRSVWLRLIRHQTLEGRPGSGLLRRGMPMEHYLLRQVVVPPRLWARQAKVLLWPLRRELFRHYPWLPARLHPLARVFHPFVIASLGVVSAGRALIGIRPLRSDRSPGFGKPQTPANTPDNA